MSDLILTLLVMNMMAAAAVAAVMALRLPVRRLFGAQVAYGLWILVPLAALAILLPAREIVVAAPAAAAQTLADPPPPTLPFVETAAAFDPWTIGALAWIAGGLASLAWLAWRQHQFARAVRDGRAGPAVVGVLKPRIVTPDDFAGLYTPREQEVVLAHEATHIARHDARVNALVALARCANWFNPAIHVMAHWLRIDQELACDARVVAAHPQARRCYAEAMLKTQLAARPLPLGCHWAPATHPLADRIRLLAQASPSRLRGTAGWIGVALLGLGGAGAAWAAKPARVILAPSPSPAPYAAPAPAARTPTLPPAATSSASKSHAAPKAASVAAPEPALAPAAPEAAALQAAQADAVPQAQPAPLVRTRGMRPLIAPGSAVRVAASTVDPDGVDLSSDMTSFGSNPLYRKGWYQRTGSRYGLYTSVFQHGDRYWVTASVTYARQPVVAGGVSLASGETGEIQLANGQVVRVTATARPETADETEAAQAASDQREIAMAVRERMPRYRIRPAAPIY